MFAVAESRTDSPIDVRGDISEISREVTVGIGIGVAVGIGVGVGIGVAVGEGAGVAVGVEMGVAVGVGVGFGVLVGACVGVEAGVATGGSEMLTEAEGAGLVGAGVSVGPATSGVSVTSPPQATMASNIIANNARDADFIETPLTNET